MLNFLVKNKQHEEKAVMQAASLHLQMLIAAKGS
jgi:hypothetical protein